MEISGSVKVLPKPAHIYRNVPFLQVRGRCHRSHMCDLRASALRLHLRPCSAAACQRDIMHGKRTWACWHLAVGLRQVSGCCADQCQWVPVVLSKQRNPVMEQSIEPFDDMLAVQGPAAVVLVILSNLRHAAPSAKRMTGMSVMQIAQHLHISCIRTQLWGAELEYATQ